jgi:hypothetical protein
MTISYAQQIDRWQEAPIVAKQGKLGAYRCGQATHMSRVKLLCHTN